MPSTIGLVDRLGSLDDAIAAAAERAGLGDDYGVRYLEKELGFRERALLSMLGSVNGLRVQRGPAAVLLSRLDAQLQTLVELSDPANRYALCFCEVW